MSRVPDFLLKEFEEALRQMIETEHVLHLFDVRGGLKDMTFAIVLFPTADSQRVIEALRPILETQS